MYIDTHIIEVEKLNDKKGRKIMGEALCAFLVLFFILLFWFVSIMLHNQREEENKQIEESIKLIESIAINETQELYSKILKAFYAYNALTIQEIMYLYPELKIEDICVVIQSLVKKNILIEDFYYSGRFFTLNTNTNLETVINEFFNNQEGE